MLLPPDVRVEALKPESSSPPLMQREGDDVCLPRRRLPPYNRGCALGPCLRPRSHAVAHQKHEALAARNLAGESKCLLPQIFITRDQSVIAQRTARRGHGRFLYGFFWRRNCRSIL